MAKDKSSSSKSGKPNLIDVTADLNLGSSNTFFCNTCKKNKPKPTGSTDSHVEACWECKSEEEQEEKDRHFADLKKLSIEERVAKIESALYSLQRTQHVCAGSIIYK